MKRILSLCFILALSSVAVAQTDMIIYQNYGPILVYPLADVDTITYSEGSLGSAPIIETLPVFNELGNSAASGGVISYTGESEITSRGICWSNEPNPDFTDQVNVVEGSDYFVASISGLVVANELSYHVRAFAINETDTAYGNEVVFFPGLSPCEGQSTVSDLEGNEYNVIELGEQCWMTENLRTSVFANGDTLQEFTEVPSGFNAYPGYYYYDFDESYNVPYGKLYPQIAIEDNRNLCPVGWKVPLMNDWHELITFLNPDFDPDNGYVGNGVGGALKANNELWNPPNVGAENSLGFNAVPGGNLFPNMELEIMEFQLLGDKAFYAFKSSSQDGGMLDYTYFFELSKGSNDIALNGILDPNQFWTVSVRCVKN